MSPGGVVLLLWWLSDRGAAVWRYSTNSPNLRIFGVRSTIHLEYEGTSFSEWSVPELCSVKEKRWTKTDLRCSSPGFHEIKPIVTGPVEEESRFLSVDNSRFCFSWYYRVTSFLQNLTQAVSIWVYDPENADPEELTWKAGEPSLNSRILTRQLATLGQKPTIITVLKRKHFFSKRLSSNGVWKVSIPMTKSDILKNIMGNKVALQDCFVADLLFLMTFPLRIAPEIPGSLPLTVPKGKQLIVDWEACIPSSLVVVAEMDTFQTNDSFITWTKIRVPPGILNDDERHKVTDMCLSRGKIYFVINGVLYLKDFHKFVRLGRNENLPDNGIIGTASRRWCWVSYLMKSQGQRSNVAVWTENEAYLDVWYQPNNIRQQGPHTSLKFSKIITTAELKNILHLSPAATLTIHGIEYTAHPLELALLLSYCVFCTSSRKIYLVIYNEDTKEFVHQDFAVDVPVGSSLAFRFLYSAVPEVLLWDKHRVYYSNYNFKESGILKTPTENGNLSKLSQDSSIQDVLLDYFGNVIIKMENNVMFYSKINVNDVIKLHLWTNTTVKTFFSMDVTGLFYAVYISEKGDLQRQHYPLELEAKSAIFQNNEECPYFVFHTNLGHIFYFLDKREALSFWVQMTYQENTGLYIISESYGPKIIKEKRKLTFEIILGRCTKTMVVKFSQDVNYEAADNYFQLQEETSGLVLYNIRPSGHSKACLSTKKVFQVAVGCNPKKYIMVQGFSKTGCVRHNFSYVIDKAHVRHRPSENLKINYDWESYGCPVKLDFREKFKPVVLLFDDNGLIEHVKVNLIVWEIHGRDDYSFNTTMEKSGCLNEAQTWKSMIELNKHLPLEKAWGPENYRHCFSYAIGKPGDLNQPYEIINDSNYNHITWPLDHAGIYVFGVKVLDPNYRPNGYLVASFVFVLILVLFSILVFSYFQYMKIYRQYIYEPLPQPKRKQKQM